MVLYMAKCYNKLHKIRISIICIIPPKPLYVLRNNNKTPSTKKISTCKAINARCSL
jgi:hypothetical protein